MIFYPKDKYDNETLQLQAEKAHYLAWTTVMVYISGILFFIAIVAGAAVYNNNSLCHTVDAKYQYMLQHAAEVVVPIQDGE